MTDEEIEQQAVEHAVAHSRDRKTHRWLQITRVGQLVGLTVLAVLVALLFIRQESRDNDARDLAQEVQAECDSGTFTGSICDKAEAVEKNVETDPILVPGPSGEPGADSTVPGPRGTRGSPGADSTVPGPAGATGSPGADSTVPGPKGDTGSPGADSTVPGPKGDTGSPGADSTVPGPKGDPGVTPGTYTCPDGQYMRGFTVGSDGTLTLDCTSTGLFLTGQRIGF